MGFGDTTPPPQPWHDTFSPPHTWKPMAIPATVGSGVVPSSRRPTKLVSSGGISSKGVVAWVDGVFPGRMVQWFNITLVIFSSPLKGIGVVFFTSKRDNFMAYKCRNGGVTANHLLTGLDPPSRRGFTGQGEDWTSLVVKMRMFQPTRIHMRIERQKCILRWGRVRSL